MTYKSTQMTWTYQKIRVNEIRIIEKINICIIYLYINPMLKRRSQGISSSYQQFDLFDVQFINVPLYLFTAKY